MGSEMLEVRSLNMALSMLSLKLTSKSTDVSVADWDRLQGQPLSDLLTLAELHSDARIRSMSKMVGRVVATHGIVVGELVSINTYLLTPICCCLLPGLKGVSHGARRVGRECTQ